MNLSTSKTTTKNTSISSYGKVNSYPAASGYTGTVSGSSWASRLKCPIVLKIEGIVNANENLANPDESDSLLLLTENASVKLRCAIFLWKHLKCSLDLLHAALSNPLHFHSILITHLSSGQRIMSPPAGPRVNSCAFVWQAVTGNQQLHPLTQCSSQRETLSAALSDWKH